MKIAAAVILFYPDKKTIDNALSYSRYVHTLYALDNTENTDVEISGAIKQIDNCRYIHDGENKGIAIRLNQACRLARQEGFEWLLTMDQDTSFDEKSIANYITCVQGLKNQEQVAMTGVEYLKKENKETSCTYTEVTSLITSGSMVNLALYNDIGVFDEALFIDQVDLEYCIRAITKGYKIIHFSHILLEHSLGVTLVRRSLKNFKKTFRSLHSPLRIYYMARNYLYLKARYDKSFPDELAEAKKDLMVRIKNNILYGRQRLLLLKLLLKANADFKKNKMGKIT